VIFGVYGPVSCLAFCWAFCLVFCLVFPDSSGGNGVPQFAGFRGECSRCSCWSPSGSATGPEPETDPAIVLETGSGLGTDPAPGFATDFVVGTVLVRYPGPGTATETGIVHLFLQWLLFL